MTSLPSAKKQQIYCSRNTPVSADSMDVVSQNFDTEPAQSTNNDLEPYCGEINIWHDEMIDEALDVLTTNDYLEKKLEIVLAQNKVSWIEKRLKQN